VPFDRSDLVMRARDLIFHVECFRCAVCERLLAAGDEFAVTAGDRLCCRADLDLAAAGNDDAVATATVAKGAATDDDGLTGDVGAQFNNNNENETKNATVNKFSGEYFSFFI